MANRGGRVTGVVIVAMIAAGCLQNLKPEPGVPRISKEELRGLLGRQDALIIDVRQPEDWNKSQQKIVGAVREDPEKDIRSWATRYPKDKTIVFYCA